MTDSDTLRQVLSQVLNKIDVQTWRTLLFSPMQIQELDWYLARLMYVVSPAYLPFASNDSGILAIYLWPGCALDSSPVVYIPDDGQNLHFVCESLPNFPIGLWLLVASYFKDRQDVLRKAIDMLVESIPSARPVPEVLWNILEESPQYEPTWWYANCSEYTSKAWEVAQVGHPFVGVPNLGRRTKPLDAVAQLEPFVREHPKPELLDLLVSAQLKAGLIPIRKDIFAILAAEAWLGADCLLAGRWRVRGKGMCIQDSVLRNLPDFSLLSDSVFEMLAEHPNTYAGEDKEDPLTLAYMGEKLRDSGRFDEALHQFRNAMTLAIIALGGYPKELALVSAAACDKIRKDSLAAVLARHVAGIDRNSV